MKKKIGIILLIIAVVSAGAVYYFANNPNAIEVETYEVKKGEISKYVEETGTVKSRSNRKIYSKTSGEIEDVMVEIGDSVKSGDLLLKFDENKINLEIKSIEAQLDGLRASYKEAIKPVDEEEIDKAQANIESINVSLEEAKRQFENNKKLYEEGAISQEAYRTSKNQLEIEKKNFQIAQKELELLKKGVSGNIKNRYESEIAQLAYQIEILEESKNDLVIEAPIDGIITELPAKSGLYANPGIEIAEIGSYEDLYVEVDVLASEVGDMTQGVLTEISSEDYGIHAKGSVAKIHPKAFSKMSDLGIEQKRVRVEIDIPREIKSNLKLGYEVDANILIVSVKDAIIARENSIFEVDDEKHVFVIKDNKANLRKVDVGLEGKDMVAIRSGLKVGEKIVISPSEEMEDGVSVRQVGEEVDKE